MRPIGIQGANQVQPEIMIVCVGNICLLRQRLVRAVNTLKRYSIGSIVSEPFSQPDTVRWSTSCRSGFSESGVCLRWDFITNNSVVCSSSQYGVDVNSNGKIYCQNAISQTDIDTRNEWKY